MLNWDQRSTQITEWLCPLKALGEYIAAEGQTKFQGTNQMVRGGQGFKFNYYGTGMFICRLCLVLVTNVLSV